MNNLKNAFWIEWHKALRSKMPLWTGLAFLLMPVACAFLMFIYKNPDFARKSGLISAKANLMVTSVDWPSYLHMLNQGIAIGGMMFFSLVISWIFGREFADGTIKDFLAVPLPRASIVLAKFLVFATWSVLLTLEVLLVGLLMGMLINLQQGSALLFGQGIVNLIIAVCLVLLTLTPFAFLASVGRGYLLPLGLTILVLILANVAIVIGWGHLFPWSIAAMYAEGGAQAAQLEPASYAVVVGTALLGLWGTSQWWMCADQNR
jgi:ABC-2 type transport system permease protein